MNILQISDASERHLGRAIQLQAQQHGDKPYLLFADDTYTFAEVNQRVNELAAGLAALGLQSGERLAFFMSSAPEVIFLVLATNKLGAVWVPINTDYKGEWLIDTINGSRPTVLVSDAEHVERLLAVRDSLAVPTLVMHGEHSAVPGAFSLQSLYIAGAGEPDMSALSTGDTCSVLWTSGTTGKAKGVMQSHNVWFNASLASNEACQYGIAEDDIVFTVLPMYNSAVWVTAIFRALFGGIPLAVDPGFSVKTFWQRVDHYKATQCFTLGAMHMFLWEAPAREDDASHSLRKLMAIPMPPAVAEPFCQRFNLELVPQGLGQSEAMRLIAPVSGRTQPPGSCGSVVDGVEARLVGDDGRDVATGEPGELWVKPLQPHFIFNGYFDNPEATAAAFEGPWYKTGDLLKCNDEGFYYFCDRKKDAVRYKGRNISTFEVELAVRRHPAIADCAAFGIPSEELEAEQEIMLDVILKPGETLQAVELAQFINDNAPYFFVPRYIHFVDALPYTPTNKVQKFRLRERGVTASTWDARAAGFKASR
ncbi:Crotonobetaine/carnitine--CoA ligase [Halioglobus japonicus]|nr:Crotonobetaine/carnitine--CoA ligase [Halioglobus japonicus]